MVEDDRRVDEGEALLEGPSRRLRELPAGEEDLEVGGLSVPLVAGEAVAVGDEVGSRMVARGGVREPFVDSGVVARMAV